MPNLDCMKFKLNFDAMIFAGEVFQCVLCGPGDDFFTEEEKDVLNRLESSLFTESKFWDAPRNGMCDYLTYIGANIRKNGVYYFRMVEAWNFLFSFIVKYKEVINPMSKKLKDFVKIGITKIKFSTPLMTQLLWGFFTQNTSLSILDIFCIIDVVP